MLVPTKSRNGKLYDNVIKKTIMEHFITMDKMTGIQPFTGTWPDSI